MNVVLDTNVLFAAFTFEGGACANVLLATLNRYDLILSEHILDELRRNLTAKGRIGETKVNEVIAMLREVATIVNPVQLDSTACRDESDLPVLGTALAGNAHVLVTGDKDLLTLISFRAATILSPRAFIDRFLQA